MKIDLNDTIAAIATPIGEGGIGIVRLSGKDARAIADKAFMARDGAKASEYETYTTHYGHIVAKRDEGRRTRDEVIDEVLLTVMKAPKSYTCEDVVEINCHGGIVPLKKVLELALSLGARLAEPGEFTKRAFLNGRIDLAQAEAVLDVINAKTEKSLDAALLQLEGSLSNAVTLLKDRLIDIKANLEASLDFPDEALEIYSREEMSKRLAGIRDEVAGFVKSFEFGKIIRNGLTCVICGKPNAGKSSLMNVLLNEERVIVTPVPGTTRDAVCERANVGGIPVNMVDTAGIWESGDMIEKEGMIKSRLWLDKSDLVLFVIDASTGLTDDDNRIIELIKNKEVMCILNKIDLTRRMEVTAGELGKRFSREVTVVPVSVLKRINLDGLNRAITDSVWKGKAYAGDSAILTNVRHRDSFSRALGFIDEAAVSVAKSHSEELIAVSINDAIGSLAEVTGETVSADVLDRIFSQFCIGK